MASCSCFRWISSMNLDGWYSDTESWAGGGDGIKTMQLYSDIERIENELRELGIEEGGAVSVAQLNRFDSLHYEGNCAVDAAAQFMGLDAKMTCGGIEGGAAASSSPTVRVLDVGSGLGGPARYLADQFACHVTALELQSDVHAKAAQLTERAGLEGSVEHVCGDILSTGLGELGEGRGSFGAVTSWLVFLHIPDKKALLGKCAEMLRPGGQLYAEDFFRKGDFSPSELRSLAEDVYCESLPTQAEYVAACESAGLEVTGFEDKTDDWAAFVTERLVAFRGDRARFVRVHSEATYKRLLHFYTAVQKLFAGGHLGGVRLCAGKPGYEDTAM